MKIAALALLACFAALGGCSGSTGPDGGGSGSSSSGGNGSSGNGCSKGSAGGSSSGQAACPLGSGCTLSSGTGGACCASGCADPTSDPANCGGCGFACPSGATCVSGYCTIASCAGASSNLSCALPDSGPGACCGGACLDPQSSFNGDPLNCGGCGDACETGSLCSQGSCTLADGGSGDCTLNSDCPAGENCDGNGCQPRSCQGAIAGAVCALPTTASGPSGICCNGGCVDSQWDDSNCGGCGFACPSGQDCIDGACSPRVSCGSATAGATCLITPGNPGTCCGALCVDLNADPANCGDCALACPSGGSCEEGACQLDDGGSASCTPPDLGCPPGTLCAGGGACLPATCSCGPGFCFLGVQSGAGICCGGSCVDPTQDPGNCGACGVSCASGVCAAGCIPGGTSCAAVGGCPSGESCVGGQCQETDCTMFQTTLCAASDNAPGVCCFAFGSGGLTATCSDPATDAANCGGCGLACPSGQSCVRGLCSGTAAPCAAGHVGDGCDLDGGLTGLCCPGGGCSDPNRDANNCGYCGNACTSPQTCVAGNCQ